MFCVFVWRWYFLTNGWLWVDFLAIFPFILSSLFSVNTENAWKICRYQQHIVCTVLYCTVLYCTVLYCILYLPGCVLYYLPYPAPAPLSLGWLGWLGLLGLGWLGLLALWSCALQRKWPCNQAAMWDGLEESEMGWRRVRWVGGEWDELEERVVEARWAGCIRQEGLCGVIEVAYVYVCSVYCVVCSV